jgi:hypothetical protein
MTRIKRRVNTEETIEPHCDLAEVSSSCLGKRVEGLLEKESKSGLKGEMRRDAKKVHART